MSDNKLRELQPAIHETDTDDLLVEALKQFDNAYMPYQEERKLALEDRKFASISGASWDGDWSGLITQTVKVEVNKLSIGVQNAYIQIQKNTFGVEYKSEEPEGDDLANILTKSFQADMYFNNGNQAVLNAKLDALCGGFGAICLENNYCDDEDETEDKQRISFGLIVDADQSVFFDPNSKYSNKSDAMYCFVLTGLTLEAFKEKYPDASNVSWPQTNKICSFDWFRPDVIYVTEYYKIIKRKRKYNYYKHMDTKEVKKLAIDDDDFRKDKATLSSMGYRYSHSRTVVKKECRKWVLSGAEILSEPEGQIIAGGKIPIVPFFGMRSYVDGLERFRGMVRLGKDAARVYNAQISKLVETVSTAPQQRPIFYPQQIAGHEQSWADSNIDRHPYALINPIYDTNGNVIPMGAIDRINPPVLDTVVSTLLGITSNDIEQLTYMTGGARDVKANVSGDAMDIAAQRSDDYVSMYLNNFKESMQYLGKLYLSMAKDIYIEDDRELKQVTYDDLGNPIISNTKINNKDFVGLTEVKFNSIQDFKGDIIATVTEHTSTQRDKVVRRLTNMAQMVLPTDPQLGNILVGSAFLNMDGLGITQVQKWLRNKLINEGVIEPTEEEAARLEELKAQEQQVISPEQKVLEAEAQRIDATTQKTLADVKLSEAKTLETLSKADIVPPTQETVEQKPTSWLSKLKQVVFPTQ